LGVPTISISRYQDNPLHTLDADEDILAFTITLLHRGLDRLLVVVHLRRIKVAETAVQRVEYVLGNIRSANAQWL